jgi:nucleotide-binding universal stress UspA family protein
MYNTIVVGTNGTPTARSAVLRAARLASLCNARLLVVAAYKDTGATVIQAMGGQVAPMPPTDTKGQTETMLKDLARDLSREGLHPETFAFPGSAVQALLEIAEAEHADLIVVGNKGMSGARRYLGSVPSNVAHQAPCSVLIVNTTS